MHSRLFALFSLLSLSVGFPLFAQDDVKQKEEVLARGPLHEAYATPTEGRPEAPPLLKKQPPEPIEELPPEQKPEGDNVQWIPGYWSWDEERKDFIWISGFWRVPPRNGLGFPVLGAGPRTVGNGPVAFGHPRAKRKQNYSIYRNPLPRSMSKGLRPLPPVRSTFMFQGIGTTEINMFGGPAFGSRSSPIGFGFLRIIDGPPWDMFLSRVIGIIP